MFLTPFQRAPDGEEFSWLIVDGLQLPMLRTWRLSAARPELIRLLNDLGKGKALPRPLEEQEQDQDADDDVDDAPTTDDETDDADGGRKRKLKWDPVSEECQAAAKELRRSLLALKEAEYGSPGEVRASLFADDNGAGRVLLTQWAALLELARPAVRREVDGLLKTIQASAEHLDEWQDQTDDEVGVEGALALLGMLIRVGIHFVSATRAERFLRLKPYLPVDYDVLANQIAAEIRAFQEAARAAAVHQTVFGSLVENHLRMLLERWIRPASVSSGAVAGLRFENQIDGIIWDHRVLPALVERGDVAVVPAAAVFGIFEIKAGKAEDLARFSARIDDLRELIAALRSQDARLRLQGAEVPVLGVLVRSRDVYEDVRVLTGHNVTALLHEDEAGDLHVNVPGVFDVLRFVFEAVNPALAQRR